MRISRRFFKALLTSAVWWIGVAISIVLHMLIVEMMNEKARVQLDYQTENAELAIKNRVDSYINVLRGAAALFYVEDHVTRAQFHAYVQQLNLRQSFPGIASINYAQRVVAADKEAFEESVRNDTSLDPNGYPGFKIIPPGDRSEYQVLTYLEPLDINISSFGLDFTSNPRSARSFAVARDDGQLISSGRLIHVKGPYRFVGLAMRIPIYRQNKPNATVAERRANLIGSVGAGYDLGELMHGVIDRNTLRYLQVRLYDAGSDDGALATGTADPERLLYDSSLPSGVLPTTITPPGANFFVKRVSMTVGRRVWEIEFAADKSKVLDGYESYLPWLVLIGGLVASLMLYSSYYFLMTARRRAIELAKEMTRDLRSSEASLAEAQHMAHLGSWLLDPDSGKMSWSAETYRIFGVPRAAEAPRYRDFLDRIHEEDRQRVREGLEHSAKTGEEFNTEHRIVQPDGAVRWVETVSRRGSNERDMLLRGIVMDVTERKQTVEALKRSQELLRELTAYQDRVKEDERKRIAREIHDELGQTLLALRIDVSMLDARTGTSHPRLNQKVRDALQHIDATVKTIRTIINNLRPAVLDLGLAAAIEWQVNEFRRRSGIDCDLVMDEKELAVDDVRSTSLFRILQESLTNVIRHANASRVIVQLYQEENRLVMKITDNGVGIHQDPRKTANAFGLVGVEERILALDGTFTINSAPGKGTTLTIYIPLQTAGDEPYRQTA